MNTREMNAQIAAVKAAQLAAQPKVKGAKPSASTLNENSFLDGVGHVVGSVPSVAVGFLASIKAGYIHAEYKRKGLL